MRTGDIAKALMLFPHKYYQLLLIASVNSHKQSFTLKQLVEGGGYFYINLNLALAEHLMTVPTHDRCLYINQYIDEIVKDICTETIIFDHIEILFEKPLKINPLALLKNLSRYRRLIAAWPGVIKDDALIYAKAGHHEYVKYPIEVDFTVIDIDRIKL
ncbi:MAG TPA: BREX-3 system P-loop-containing protein BrxF [Firmicutes bacterium]|jgi:hypothetical protein|nr:BREX-3 system P-loop-containing protein BrxF [Bacillota bacterium]